MLGVLAFRRTVSVALVALAAGCKSADASAPTGPPPLPASVNAGSPDAAPPAAANVPAAVGADQRCPPEMAAVGAFCIDRWEAHLVTVDGGVETSFPHVKRPVAGVRYEARSEAGTMPQGYISRIEAAAACKNAGKRLCTAEEWLRACEGAEQRKYPYGASHRKGACNSEKPHAMQALFGRDMRIYTFESHYNSPKLNLHPGFLAKTGEHEGCVTPEGVADLVGNLHEWVADDVDHRFRKLLTARKVDYKVFETATDGNGAFLGGFYSTKEQLGTGCGYITPAHEPAYHDYSTGFRCCR